LCILNPREQQPLTRYNIDPMTLAEAGIREEAAERIYKSLFVYSVGFFELLKQQMQNIADSDYIRIQKSLWLVYAVLLEYACKTDYQLLISKITFKHEQDLAKVAKSFQDQAKEEFEHRKTLQQNLYALTVERERLEKSWNNEKDLRIKLEEEYMVMSRNHEEEVGLRL
jgi:hypothetical protein